MISRRSFLEAAGLLPVAGAVTLAAPATAVPARRKLAIVTTVWHYQSHAQHMGDRFLVGYPHAGRWHQPPFDVVGVFVAQRGEHDQSSSRAEQFGFQVYPTIAAALRAGQERLSVDAVLIIGEHGDYPRNELGQVLYPRHEFFRQVTDVFRADGRAVPVFNDKHLSYSFELASDMVHQARELKFPLMAGSSLPVTWRLPDVDLPWQAEVDEALMVGVGGSDAMDFHALEAMQCLLERRRGGEVGIRAVQLLDGDAVWQAAEEGRWSRALLAAALSRSNELQGLSRSDARPQDLVNNGELPKLAREPAAYLIEYRDGLRATLLMLGGAVQDFTFAAKLKDVERPLSTLFYLPPTPNVEYSAELMHHVEQMFVTGQAGYPVERTLLVSGLLESCLKSRQAKHQRLLTPHLGVTYQPAERSFSAQATAPGMA